MRQGYDGFIGGEDTAVPAMPAGLVLRVGEFDLSSYLFDLVLQWYYVSALVDNMLLLCRLEECRSCVVFSGCSQKVFPQRASSFEYWTPVPGSVSPFLVVFNHPNRYQRIKLSLC